METLKNQTVSDQTLQQTSEQTMQETTAITKRSNIPTTDLELLNLCINIEQKWKVTPQLTLMWTTIKEFSKYILNFKSVYEIRTSTGSIRPVVTHQLKDLDKLIEENTSYIKGYISDKFGKNEAISHYAEFGIIKERKSYTLPADRDFRNEALKKLLGAIVTNGLGDKTYGEVYWTKISKDYNSLLQKATSTDSTVSMHVSSKNEIKKYMKKSLNAISHLLRANFPDTFKSELRNWGFHKEKY